MDAVTIIREAHSGWRYLVIAIAIVALVKLLIGLVSRSKWSKLDQALGAAFPIIFDIQLLLGLVLWVLQGRWSGEDMLRSWEHPIIMIVSILVAHIAWSRTKKAGSDAGKFRTAFIGFLIAALVMGLGVAQITGYIGG
jgi:hypothetical protein